MTIKNPLTGASTTQEGLLDTGYDGLILLPWSTYMELGLRKCELPRNLWSVGVSVTGEEFPLRTAHVEVEIDAVRRLALAETYHDNALRLIGRGFIESHVTILDGPKKLLRVKVEERQPKLRTLAGEEARRMRDKRHSRLSGLK